MIFPLRLSVILAALALASGCATPEHLAAAGDVRSLLVAIRDDDHAAFDAHVDRRALEAQLQARLVDRTAAANLPGYWKGVGLALSGPMARVAGEVLVQPEVFRAVADYYGYRPETPIPGTLVLASALRSLPDGRVCAARSGRDPCLLTFADEGGVWRLVGFNGDAAMLRLKSPVNRFTLPVAWPASLACVTALGRPSPARAATLRIFSYDPASPETREASGAITLEIRQNLIFTTVLRMLATEGQAGADLRPAGEAELGRGGLSGVIGARAPEHDLYAVQPTHEGPAMIAALCPGSTRGWMAIGHVKAERDLRVFVLGDSPKGSGARVCRKLDFTWHGEWRLPTTGSFDPRISEPPHFPP